MPFSQKRKPQQLALSSSEAAVGQHRFYVVPPSSKTTECYFIALNNMVPFKKSQSVSFSFIPHKNSLLHPIINYNTIHVFAPPRIFTKQFLVLSGLQLNLRKPTVAAKATRSRHAARLVPNNTSQRAIQFKTGKGHTTANSTKAWLSNDHGDQWSCTQPLIRRVRNDETH